MAANSCARNVKQPKTDTVKIRSQPRLSEQLIRLVLTRGVRLFEGDFMRFMKTLMVATLLLSSTAPALAHYDWDDYRHDVREHNRHVRRAIERDMAYRNGYRVVVSPGYYSTYGDPYYGDYYYRYNRTGSVVNGILNSIFR